MRPRITPPDAERESARDYLRRQGLRGARPFAVSPVASLALKQWPLERLARLADAQVAETGEPVLAFCGPQQSAGDALRAYMRHGERLVCVGPLPLLRVAALLERCRALVCNDTGLMHMAAALGVPTVAVFGPTVPSIYRPPGERVVSVGGEPIDCPHRNTGSLHPPECFGEGRCLLAKGGCIGRAREEEVREALRQLLHSLEWQPCSAPSVA
jgi:ADP-heptose:LPS heptosyltransferase